MSIGSFGSGLGIVGFIWVRWVHSGASWGSLDLFRCSLGAVAFIWAPPWGSKVHLGSLLHALVVIVFISARPCGCWLHLDS